MRLTSLISGGATPQDSAGRSPARHRPSPPARGNFRPGGLAPGAAAREHKRKRRFPVQLRSLALALCVAALAVCGGHDVVEAQGRIHGRGAGRDVHSARGHGGGFPAGHPCGLPGAAAAHQPRVARCRRPARLRHHRAPGQPLRQRPARSDRHVDVQPAHGRASVPGQQLPALRGRRPARPAARRAGDPDRGARPRQPVRVVGARAARPQTPDSRRRSSTCSATTGRWTKPATCRGWARRNARSSASCAS